MAANHEQKDLLEAFMKGVDAAKGMTPTELVERVQDLERKITVLKAEKNGLTATR